MSQARFKGWQSSRFFVLQKAGQGLLEGDLIVKIDQASGKLLPAPVSMHSPTPRLRLRPGRGFDHWFNTYRSCRAEERV